MTIESLLTSTFVLAVLVFTQYSSVPGGDGGELMAESCLGGISHPPGYPLFIMLGNIAVRFGMVMKSLTITFHPHEYHLEFLESMFSPAKCVNTLCCVFGAAGCYLLSNSISLYLSSYDSKDSIKDHRYKKVLSGVCGAIGGAVFSLSPLTWEYTRMAEVFALNNLIICCIIYQFVRFGKLAETAQAKFDHVLKCSMKGAFLSGLAMSNQHTSLLFIVPIAVYVLVIIYGMIPSDKKVIMMIRVTGNLALCFVGGLLPYVYLYITSHFPTPGTWGDQRSIQGIIRHILRSEYGSLSLSAGKFPNVEGSVIRWISYIKNTFKQVTAVGVFLSCQGILYSTTNFSTTIGCFKDAGVWLFFTLLYYLTVWNGIISNLPLSNPMAYEVQSRFYLQPNILVCFFLGVGLNCVLSRFFVLGGSNSRNDEKYVFYMTSLCRLALVLVLGGCFTRQHIRSYWVDPSTKGMLIHDYADTVLSSLPEQSLLLSYSDLNWNSIRYLQTCEDKRKDVTHLSLQLIPYPWFEAQQSQLYPNIVFPRILDDISTERSSRGYSKYLIRLLKANMKKATSTGSKGGIYIEMQGILDTDIKTGGLFKDEFTLIPWGAVYRVLPRTDDDDDDDDDGAQTFRNLREKWQPMSLNQVSRAIDKMKRHKINMVDSSKVSRGSWEFATISVLWDMYYQLALHTLGIALTLPMAMKKDPSLVPVYIESLRISSKLLLQVDDANEKYNGIVK